MKPTGIWIGDEETLPVGAAVEVIAIDYECPDPRGAAWVRFWPDGEAAPQYRSCDLSDITFDAT